MLTKIVSCELSIKSFDHYFYSLIVCDVDRKWLSKNSFYECYVSIAYSFQAIFGVGYLALYYENL